MSRPLTQITLYKNTPFLDFQNTVHFKNNQERDAYFKEKYTGDNVITFKKDFNFVRDRLNVNLNIKYSDLDGVNYCQFISERDNIVYYGYVVNYEYLTDVTTKLRFIIDPVMTFTQGNVLEKMPNIEVIRQHLSKENYNFYLPMLQSNDDVLKTSTKKYIHQKAHTFKNFYVVFQSSVDLSKEFGEVDDPKLFTSQGNIRDKVTSPLNLYVVLLGEFNDLMKNLQPFPWITQNINKIMMVPFELIDEADLQKVTMKKPNDNVSFLKTFKQKSLSKNEPLDNLKYKIEDIMKICMLDKEQDKHLFRSEYLTLEFYTYDGQSMLLDPFMIDSKTGIDLQMLLISGYANEIRIYPKDYGSTDKEEDLKGHKKGSFLNTSLSFSNFDELPVLIDNYNLALSKTANQRELTESKLFSNRVKNIANPKADLLDRFMDSVSMLSDFTPRGIFGKFSDEYEYYRTKQAEYKDLALNSPTVTNQTTGNAFNIKNDIFGLNFKISFPDVFEIRKIKKYYKMFGYEIDEMGTSLDKVDSMSICNYVQFKGNWNIKGVDVALMEQLRVQFENGIRLWHYDGSVNPMNKSVMENKIIK